ncbi:uncharacterized protein LOC116306126 [Actinia tenebrosa]|uniref:Uncharacterized protein LOC116306126 n=1 Tax=Actinia tenebrosa TaxID=6105 RepID=A0A6P8IXC5_ACTTE|nr:uncharacterized protein LOC116306126 [Actinia tenebrosa]
MGWLRDYFKSFFDIPQKPLNPNELPREIQEDFYRQFGHNFESRQWPEPHIYEQFDDFDEQRHNDIVVIEGGDMFREMESMFENFFKGFPLNFNPQDRSIFDPRLGIESPSDDPSQQDQEEPGSLKDKMLKHPDTENYQEFSYNDEGHDAPGIGPHSWFGELWTSPFRHMTHPDEKLDKDLDSELESGIQSLDEILSQKGNDPSESLKSMRPWSSSSSSSFLQVTTIDSQGRTESRTTRRDSSGREEVTVTRKIGDQEHTVKHWKNEDGLESSEEKTVNIDQDDVSEFNQKWSQSNEDPLSIKDNDTTQQDPLGLDSFYKNILDQFFPRRR